MRTASETMLPKWLTAIAVTLLACGLYVSCRQTLRLRWRSQLDELRQQGLPVSGAELDDWYEIPPAGSNAANLYLEAHRSLRRASKDQVTLLPFAGGTNLSSRTEALSDDMRQAIEVHLANNADTLQLLHAAYALKLCRYPVEFQLGFGMLLPHLSPTRECVRLLALEAVMAAENSDATGAVTAIEGSLSVARSLDREPMLLSQLVRITCCGISVQALERSLTRVPFDQQDLVRLSTVLAEAESEKTYRRAMVGELCNGESIFGASATELFEGLAGVTPNPAVVVATGFYRAAGLMDLDNAEYVRVMRNCIRLGDLPPTARLKASESVKRAVADIPPYRTMSRMLLWPMESVVEKDLENIARLRVARAALAVERFRLDNGRLPDTLSELIPELLETVPEDPFDGAPLRYCPLPAGFIVYSIGRNGIDDGGMEINPTGKYGLVPDVTFTLER